MAQQQTTVNTSQQGLIGMPQHQIITTPNVMSMNNMGHQVKPDGNMPPGLVNVQSFVGNNIQQQAQSTNQQQSQNQQQQQQQQQSQQQQQQQQSQQQQQQQSQQPSQPQVVGSNGVNVPVAPVNSMQQQFTGTPSKGNASTTASAPNPPVGATQPTSDDTQKLLSKPRLMELVKDVDPTVQLDDEVEEMLLSIADSFVDSIANGSCKIAKHRHVQTVEVRDVQLYLEQAYNIWIPGLGTDELRPYKRSAVTEAHKQRMALIRKAKK